MIKELAWASYDYHRSIIAGGTNIFVMCTPGHTEGYSDHAPRDYVWTDHTRWSPDIAEKPISILPFIQFRSWLGKGPIDLSHAIIHAELVKKDEGDDIPCFYYFQIAGVGGRWHFTYSPIREVLYDWGCYGLNYWEGHLIDHPGAWHQSWVRDSSVDFYSTIRNVTSYGFSMVGFEREPQGKLYLSNFGIINGVEK